MVLLKRTLQFAVLVGLGALTVFLLSSRQDAPGRATSGSPNERGDVLADAVQPPSNRLDDWIKVGSQFPSTLTRPPTADEGQSKLWFHDGTWWGVLIEASTASSYLYRLDWDTQTWTDTGLLIDERSDSRADALWDGTHLYVASGGRSSNALEHVKLMRYSYDPDTQSYALDPEFPVQLTNTGVQALTIAKDTAGVVWVSYIAEGQIWFNHTRDADHSWDVPMPLPGDGTAVGPDVAVMVAYGGRIGMVWTNQADGAIYFTSHPDGEAPAAWSPTTTVLRGLQLADNHVSARSLDGPEGSTLFVVIKTSLDVLPDSDPHEAQMLLLELRPDGGWKRHVYGRLRDHHTRPLLLIDEDRRELYIFAVSPFGSGSVYYKRTSADEILLPVGLGAPFLQLPDQPEITSPTSTKQNLTASSGVMVLSSDEETDRYVYGVLPLGEGASP